MTAAAGGYPVSNQSLGGQICIGGGNVLFFHGVSIMSYILNVHEDWLFDKMSISQANVHCTMN